MSRPSRDLVKERWEAAVRRERELEQLKAALDEQLKPLFEMQGRMMPIINRHAEIVRQLQENEQELAASYETMRKAVK